MMNQVYRSSMLCVLKSISLVVAVIALGGCSLEPTARDDPPAMNEQRTFDLKEISPQQGQTLLSELGLAATPVPERNAIVVSGSTSDLYRAGVVLDLVDSRDEFLVEALSSPSHARTIPANHRIAAALGNIAVGTFANPPLQSERVRAIIDNYDQSIVAIIPARLQKSLLAFIESGGGDDQHLAETSKSSEPAKEILPSTQALSVPAISDTNEPSPPTTSVASDAAAKVEICEPNAPCEGTETPATTVVVCPSEARDSRAEPNALPRVDGLRWVDEYAATPGKGATTKRLHDPIPVANGDDVLQLDLPDHVEVSQLLDLAAEYLHIDYMYDPETIRGQSISLRLHGKLQGDIRVKDLYPLLESVLKFKGFVMTRKDNLVTIVPVTKAMQADPTLVDPNGTNLEAGDMVVTRVFHLRSISPASAMNLLDSMQMSVATSIVEETRSLIVTCYARRMERVERLLEMVDRPGRPREFRYRELKYTTAGTLCKQVQAIVSELQASPVELTPMSPSGSGPGLLVRTPVMPAAPDSRPRIDSGASQLVEPPSLYLDADERTNRILMVGPREQLTVVEEVIDALDVVQQEQRTFKVYEIKHVDAEEVRKHLVDFDLVEDKKMVNPATPSPVVDSAPPAGVQTVAQITNAGRWGLDERQKAQASVLTSSNSLLISATPVQHARIAHVIEYIDTVARQEAIPYEIYFLENQDPEHMAEVLTKLLQETVPNDQSKIEKTPPKPEEQIVIVPDKNTFSLIVYASKKNQEWIRRLITTLDKRRPQVLIDATLVEIRKNDEFNYDLEMIAGAPDLTATSGQIPQFSAGDDTTVTDRLQQSGRSQFGEFYMKSGKGVGFYADKHIQALLTAMQTKNYGRVLAKPKVLVNDNEKGNIKTADTTYVVTKSSVPVTGGTAGQQNQLIETALGYEPYEAGINLEITPHISDGNLLRLEIQLSRSDFTSTADEKPPNQTSSNVGTVVTVPDGSTIILGGMLKLNQNKGGSKVPILGDLPLVGGLFRNVDTSDVQSMLYIFVRAEVIRPVEPGSDGYEDLKRISDDNREAFERHEQEFQDHQTWPGIKPKPVSPPKVLDAR